MKNCNKQEIPGRNRYSHSDSNGNRDPARASGMNGNRLYRQLLADVRAAGCLKPAPFASGVHMLLGTGAYFGAYIALLSAPNWKLRLVLLLLLGIANVQASFVAHEVGHYAGTRNRRVVSLLGHFFMTFLIGYAHTYYRKNHKVHHAHPNEGGRDPDLEGAGLITLYPGSAKSKRGFAKLVTAFQTYLLWVLVAFQGFSAKRDSFRMMFRKLGRHPTGQIALGLHALLWCVTPVVILGFQDALVNYAIMTLCIGPYLASAILVNHIGARLLPPENKLSLLHRTLISTRDLGEGRFADYLFGGTNNHIEHHLFPSAPIYRLNMARKITRDFCVRHRLPYCEMRWTRAIGEVYTHLKLMSESARSDWREQRTVIQGNYLVD